MIFGDSGCLGNVRGGMGFLFNPARKHEAQIRLQDIMSSEKKRCEQGIPFGMEPVVYDFMINEKGSWAEMLFGGRRDAAAYYTLTVPSLLRRIRE